MIKPWASYKGFTAFHPTRNILGYGESYWSGRVANIRDVVTFKGRFIEEALQAFKDSVDDYLEFKQEQPMDSYHNRINEQNNDHEINQAKLAADQRITEELLASERKQAFYDCFGHLDSYSVGEHPLFTGVTKQHPMTSYDSGVQKTPKEVQAERGQKLWERLNAVGTQDEIHTNDKGGRQSKLSVRFDLIPAYSLKIVAQILAVGAVKYGVSNWKLIDTEDHINHAINHLYLFLSGDTTENHLGNACCRCLFALYSANHHE